MRKSNGISRHIFVYNQKTDKDYYPFYKFTRQFFLGTLQACRKRGAGGPVPPHFLTDQLTLSQPWGAHYPHPVLCALPDFQTLRRP